MDEKCGKPIFPTRGFIPTGHCGLFKNHDGKCISQVETKSEAERMSTKQLDVDLNDAWKPSRDIDDDTIPIYGIEDEL